MRQDQDEVKQDAVICTKVTLGFQLAKMAKLKRQLIDAYVADIGLSKTEWQALFWLNKLGDCTQKELLKNLDVDAGHLARVLEKLEQDKQMHFSFT